MSGPSTAHQSYPPASAAIPMVAPCVVDPTGQSDAQGGTIAVVYRGQSVADGIYTDGNGICRKHLGLRALDGADVVIAEATPLPAVANYVDRCLLNSVRAECGFAPWQAIYGSRAHVEIPGVVIDAVEREAIRDSLSARCDSLRLASWATAMGAQRQMERDRSRCCARTVQYIRGGQSSMIGGKPCHSHRCPYCEPFERASHRRRIVKTIAADPDGLCLVVLTVNPRVACDHGWYSPAARVVACAASDRGSWRAFSRALRRLDPEAEYARVLEFQDSGNPHWNVLIRGRGLYALLSNPAAAEETQRRMELAWGVGTIHAAVVRDPNAIVDEVLKLRQWRYDLLPHGARRIAYSRGFLLGAGITSNREEAGEVDRSGPAVKDAVPLAANADPLGAMDTEEIEDAPEGGKPGAKGAAFNTAQIIGDTPINLTGMPDYVLIHRRCPGHVAGVQGGLWHVRTLGEDTLASCARLTVVTSLPLEAALRRRAAAAQQGAGARASPPSAGPKSARSPDCCEETEEEMSEEEYAEYLAEIDQLNDEIFGARP